jgi:hypothetical protein
MSRRPPHPYYTPPPPSPPRKPATNSGGEVDKDLYRDVHRVLDQIRGIYMNALGMYESLMERSYTIDNEISKLYDELIITRMEIEDAARSGDLDRALSLIPGARRLAEDLLKNLDKAEEFNKRDAKKWLSVRDEAIEKIEEILKSSTLPKYIRSKIWRNYVRRLYELMGPESVYGIYRSDYKYQIDSLIAKINKIEKQIRSGERKT